ncbi:bifunctional oligoribonuclease/PAP phosphatase NrnA [Proteiniclasticum sp.]|uniref:DHH family phosphoesterase n=1 Tax=Proteiniclasticum sp. TaxID=2053595 RepID=UPI0028A28E84|nr:bifunctional oligoribonuclease/PAP phosphatase NrnA [Proteiniclasticum sp.]
MKFEDIVPKIMQTEKMALVTHASPDGDAVGSTMSLALALRSIGKDVEILSKEPAPLNLSYLALYDEYGTLQVLTEDRELLIALDCGNKDRLSMERDGFEQIDKINIDHHISNEMYGMLNHVDTKSASTAEIVFELIKALKIQMDVSMAECLYTGIVSDTGSFRFPSTTAKTLRITAEILETGIDFSRIQRILFGSSEFKRIKLLGRALMTMESHQDGFVSTMNLVASDFNTLSISDRDSGDIVNYGLEPPEADVSVLFKEAEGFFRVSVRTKSVIDASALCGKFEGGGHIRAAGCNIKADSLEEAKSAVLHEIERMRAV